MKPQYLFNDSFTVLSQLWKMKSCIVIIYVHYILMLHCEIHYADHYGGGAGDNF